MNAIISVLLRMFGIRITFNYLDNNGYFPYLGILLLCLIIVGYFVKLKR